MFPNNRLLLSVVATALLGACSGDRGPTGSAGADGTPGAAGPKGDPGADGARGATGPAGPSGVSGEPGAAGATGPKGATGSAGPSGAPGADGAGARARPEGLRLEFLGRYETGVFDEGAAEIVAYDAVSRRVFVVNASAATVDVLDIDDPSAPALIATIDAAAADPLRDLGAANSVAVASGVLAVAIEAEPKTDPGIVAFYATDTLELLGTAEVGALPDMLTFTPDGSKVLVANEGEPSDDYLIDPPGSISIITLPDDFSSAPLVQTADFSAFDGEIDALRGAKVRIFGPGATVAQDLEPEYVAISADGSTAWATLQENNAIARIDVESATVTDIFPLGAKNHALLGNELDPSDQDGRIALRNVPVFGMYMPDAIASYEVAGRTYLVTANEGDVREWGSFVDSVRLGSGAYVLDAARFPDAAELKLARNLGRLNVTPHLGDDDGDLDFDRIFAFGGRSFSIWDGETGELVYDSGNELELRTAQRLGPAFNSNNTANESGDSRSDDKGPEPEAVTVASIDGSVFAFVGMERVGGVIVYDVTLPETPRFVSYVNGRNFAVAFDGDVPAELALAGDLGPESVVFVPAEHSPIASPLLIVGNEVSGTTALYSVEALYTTRP